jgi:hypothetical protein
MLQHHKAAFKIYTEGRHLGVHFRLPAKSPGLGRTTMRVAPEYQPSKPIGEARVREHRLTLWISFSRNTNNMSRRTLDYIGIGH